jgi:hypothetical protein
LTWYGAIKTEMAHPYMGLKNQPVLFCLPGRLIAAREYKRKAGNSIYQFMCGGGFFLRPNNLSIQDLVH